jgi:hypothetical protein
LTGKAPYKFESGFLQRRITGDEYDKKARELKERQTEIAVRIE